MGGGSFHPCPGREPARGLGPGTPPYLGGRGGSCCAPGVASPAPVGPWPWWPLNRSRHACANPPAAFPGPAQNPTPTPTPTARSSYSGEPPRSYPASRPLSPSPHTHPVPLRGTRPTASMAAWVPQCHRTPKSMERVHCGRRSPADISSRAHPCYPAFRLGQFQAPDPTEGA